MSKKAVLGKGLSALLPSHPQGVEHEDVEGGTDLPKGRLYHFEERVRLLGRVAEIDVDQIKPNPYQPRTDFNEEALEELANSIRQLGIIQPITVRSLGENQFEIISGERRVRAARMAGLQQVPAYLREADTEEMLEMALVENIQREELNPLEIAISYQRLMEECKLTQEQIARKVGKNRTTVTNFLRLLRLPPRVQAHVRDGSLSAGHARMLVSVEDEDAQHLLLNSILEKSLTVRDVERMVRSWHAQNETPEAGPQEDAIVEPPASRPDTNAIQLQELTNDLRSHLSTQVSIRHKTGGSGRIEISYYSVDDLERVLELLLQK